MECFVGVPVRVGGEITDVVGGAERGAGQLEQHRETSVGRQVFERMSNLSKPIESVVSFIVTSKLASGMH
jgi:hypothetical protein